MSSSSYLRCFIYGHDRQWEAICTDLDIAVHGTSEKEVRDLLGTAIVTYIQDAHQESEADFHRLMARRSPLHVRLGLSWRTFLHTLRPRPTPTESMQQVDIACPA